jgi:O-antigen/teichoic acid export membrane protein
LIGTFFQNLYYLVIGKYFSATDLGFYTRANNFSNFPSQNLNALLNRVTYPVLAEVKENAVLLKESYRKIISSIMLITFVLMFGLAAVAEPMVITLIGEKWRPSIIYMQMLCFSSMLYPLQALNLNMLKVLGRSDLFLKLEIIKRTLTIPAVIIGILFGIKILIIGIIFNSLVAYYLNSYWSGNFIGYSMKDQLKDIMSSFLLAIGMALIVFIVGYFLKTSYLIKLIVLVPLGALIVITFCEITKMPEYLFMKQIVVEKLFRRK